MSIKKAEKSSGPGRPPGITKAKISVSVTKTVWQIALERWKGTGSDLVDRLLKTFVARKANT